MKSISCAFVLLALPLWAAGSEDVYLAAQKLAQEENYSWRTTVDASISGGVTGSLSRRSRNLAPGWEIGFIPIVRTYDGRFRLGPSEGNTEKGGFTTLSLSLGDSSTREAVQVVIKGDRIAFNRDGQWRALGASGNAGASGFIDIEQRLRTFKAPAKEAQQLLRNTEQLQKRGDIYFGQLKAQIVRHLLNARLGRSTYVGEPLPEAIQTTGWAKFWLKDGQLTQYAYTLQGVIEVEFRAHFVEGTTTVEIYDVGTTKIAVPEAAKEKLLP